MKQNKYPIVCLLFLLSFLVGEVYAQQKPVRILAIGNSFSQDAVEQYLHELADAEDIPTIIGNITIGGCSLERHLRNARTNDSVYRYHKIGLNGKKVETKKVTMGMALADEEWDYVSLQQVSSSSGMYETFKASLPELVKYVKARLPKRTQLMLHQTWAYDANATNPGFKNYNCDQLTMYHSIVDAVKKASKLTKIPIIIPSGTAIQNARTSFIGVNMTRDGYHLDLTIGRYTAACTWFEKIFKRNVLGNPYYPKGMSHEQREVAQKAAHEAVLHPEYITELTEWNEPAGKTQGSDTHKGIVRTNEKAPGIEGMRIAWDLGSKRQIASRGRYARVKKLTNHTLAAVYEQDGCVYSTSTDGGNTWSAFSHVFPNTTVNVSGTQVKIKMANPELIQLMNGDLLYAVNYRPEKEGIAPWAIAIKRSSDFGMTWSEPKVLYEADCFFENGYWEPVFLQLPDGTIQLYFANESPYRSSDEQNISMISSADNGKTWTDAVCVSFRKGKRDGMPAPAIFENEIVVAIEDNKGSQFKPYTVRSVLSNSWKQPVSGNSIDRNPALTNPLDDEIYAGAPYLIKTSTGESVLSYQSTRYSRSNSMGDAQMEVAIGDKSAKKFSKISYPFGSTWCRNALWNSLTLLNEHTIAAVASATTDSICAPWIINGYIITDLKALKRSIRIDGIHDQNEWGGEYPVFVGHKSLTNLRTSIARDDQTLFIGGVVKGVTPEMDISQNGVIICIDAANYCYKKPNSGVYKIECMLNGTYKARAGAEGEWKDTELHKVSFTARKAEHETYFWEIAIPMDAVFITGKKQIRLNVGLLKKTDQTAYREMIANSDEDASYTWCLLNL